MITIETWEALESAIAIAATLTEHRARLDDYRNGYELCELAKFVILEPSEVIDVLTPPEYVTQHNGFTETCHILSDDGFGWIVIRRT